MKALEIHFGYKEVLKTLFVLILAVAIFYGGKYASTKNETPKFTVLNSTETSVSIDLKGNVSLYSYPEGKLIVVPDSMALQVWELYTNIVKNGSRNVIIPEVKHEKK